MGFVFASCVYGVAVGEDLTVFGFRGSEFREVPGSWGCLRMRYSV